MKRVYVTQLSQKLIALGRAIDAQQHLFNNAFDWYTSSGASPHLDTMQSALKAIGDTMREIENLDLQYSEEPQPQVDDERGSQRRIK